MPAGRPPKYTTSEAMQEASDEYFDSQKPKQLVDEKGIPLYTAKGFPAMDWNPPTITGLALHLGFESRQSMYDYEKNGEFSYTIKRARMRCEHYAEHAGMTGAAPAPMAIFALKNYGWSDKQEIEHTGKDGGAIATTINIIGVPPDEK